MLLSHLVAKAVDAGASTQKFIYKLEEKLTTGLI